VCSHLEVALPHGDYRDDSTFTTTANDTFALGRSAAVRVKVTAKDGQPAVRGDAGSGGVTPSAVSNRS
jgi:hypothetical protein